MTEELKPCVWSGHEGVLQCSSDGEVEWVRCVSCGRESPLAYSAEEAVRRWNAGEVRDVAPVRLSHSAEKEALIGRPFAEWHEDRGSVLWWRLPISEPPYVGTPLDLGRTMKIEVYVGTEQHELPALDTGGWPFDAEDEPDLWWTPLPQPTFARSTLLSMRNNGNG